MSFGAHRIEGDWLVPTIGTTEALRKLPLTCRTDLFCDIVNAFHNDVWVPCNGQFPDKHDGERLIEAWDEFKELAKHRSRYFLEGERLESRLGTWPGYDNPRAFLERIGQSAMKLDLIRTLDDDTSLYRARIENQGTPFDAFEDLVAPPKEVAAAGRMNAVGIPYLYAARDSRTAAHEVVTRPPGSISIGKFRVRDWVRVLDLTALPEVPSKFDIEQYETRQAILFFNDFIHEASKPVSKDGREQVEYVPTQIVSEFFAQVFVQENGKRMVDGIVYQSVAVESGRNVVLFPPRNGVWRDVVELVATERWSIDGKRHLKKKEKRDP